MTSFATGMRLCDDAGMVAGEYLETLNRLRAVGGFGAYEGEPFACTGGCHLTGEPIHCTSPAHLRVVGQALNGSQVKTTSARSTALKLVVALAVAFASWGTIASWGTGTAEAATGPLVYVSNVSTTVPQADVDAALPAFQTAVSRDLAPAWGTDATLTTDPTLETSAQMVVEISDDANCVGCLGYHEVFGGKPTSYVFARTGAEFNESWQLTFSHELFEMLVDPWINRLAQWNGRNWLVEVCDPPESGLYAYFVDGVAISDFITPRWYDRTLRGPFDFTRHLKRAGQIGKHGYASYLDPSAFGGWSQVFGFHAKRAH